MNDVTTVHTTSKGKLWTGRVLSAIPVLMIRDGAGQAYWLTFDAPEFPELATGAAVIAARLYRAAGYLVPTVSLVRLDPEHDLVPADSVRDALASLPRDAAGRIRAAAHRVPGQPLGLFSFSGRRKDDPADSIPRDPGSDQRSHGRERKERQEERDSPRAVRVLRARPPSCMECDDHNSGAEGENPEPSREPRRRPRQQPFVHRDRPPMPVSSVDAKRLRIVTAVR